MLVYNLESESAEGVYPGHMGKTWVTVNER